ncbi:NACHT domain protein [Xylaria scruposa]|nr:NACHT domain protein [Xylaria scruposa]
MASGTDTSLETSVDEISQHHCTISTREPTAPGSTLQHYVEKFDSGARDSDQYSTIHAVVQEIGVLGRSSTRERSHTILQAITPFISFIDRYSLAIDNMAQYQSNPCSLIWGSLRILLRMAQSVPFYFDKLLEMVTDLGARLNLYNQYAKQFSNIPEFQVALADTFKDALVFLHQARNALLGNTSAKIWLYRIWTNFEQEFKEVSARLTQRLEHLSHLTTLLHRESMHQYIREQRDFRTETNKLLSRFATSPLDRLASSRWRNGDINGDYQKMLLWLASVDYAEDLHRNLQKRATATGQWILELDMFDDWFRQPSSNTSSVCWLYGNSGFGKSVLSGVIIESLKQVTRQQTQNVAILYFFFDKTREDRREDLYMYRTLLSQLLIQQEDDDVHQYLEAAFCKARKYGRTTLGRADEPLALLKQVLGTYDQVYMVVDGIDECDNANSSIGELLLAIRSVSTCRALFVSRDMPDIRAHFEGCASFQITKSHTKSDIELYLSERIAGLLGVTIGSVNEQLVYQISERADGMFLYAHLMMEELDAASCPADFSRALSQLPTGLDHLYQLVLDGLQKSYQSEQRALAWSMFSRVLCSPRPLCWAELQCSLAITNEGKPGELALHDDRRPYKSAVLRLCTPFLEYSTENDDFRVAHASVYEFLTTNTLCDSSAARKIHLPTAHREITNTCLVYLAISGLKDVVEVDQSIFPFAQYATRYWCHHLLNAELDNSVCDRARQFLTSEVERRCWLKRWFLIENNLPLQHLFQLIKKVQNVLSSSLGDQDLGTYDYMEDMLDILVGLDEGELHLGQLDGLEKNQAPIVYRTIGSFERITFTRELVREYTALGRLGIGIAHMETIQNRLERMSGVDAYTRSWPLNALGLLYDQQGKTQLALDTQERALAIQLAIPSSREFNMSLTTNELGRLNRHLGRYEESEKMHLKALECLRSLLPDTDPQIVWTFNHLAKCYRMWGRLAEAEKLHRKAWTVRVEVLGAKHPYTLWTLSDLAKCLRDLGRLSEACQLQELCNKERQETLGPLHHDTLWGINDLGLMYEKAGRLDDALNTHKEALDGQIKTLGPENKATIWSTQLVHKLQLS